MDKNSNASPKKRIRNDIIVALALITISLAVLAATNVFQADGTFAVVVIDGKETAQLDLSRDTEKVFSSDLGENTLVIKSGTAYISNADCPDGICSDHKPIKNSGETIVCLPHKLVVKIVTDGGDKNDIIS